MELIEGYGGKQLLLGVDAGILAIVGDGKVGRTTLTRRGRNTDHSGEGGIRLAGIVHEQWRRWIVIVGGIIGIVASFGGGGRLTMRSFLPHCVVSHVRVLGSSVHLRGVCVCVCVHLVRLLSNSPTMIFVSPFTATLCRLLATAAASRGYVCSCENTMCGCADGRHSVHNMLEEHEELSVLFLGKLLCVFILWFREVPL